MEVTILFFNMTASVSEQEKHNAHKSEGRYLKRTSSYNPALQNLMIREITTKDSEILTLFSKALTIYVNKDFQTGSTSTQSSRWSSGSPPTRSRCSGWSASSCHPAACRSTAATCRDWPSRQTWTPRWSTCSWSARSSRRAKSPPGRPPPRNCCWLSRWICGW